MSSISKEIGKETKELMVKLYEDSKPHAYIAELQEIPMTTICISNSSIRIIQIFWPTGSVENIQHTCILPRKLKRKSLIDRDRTLLSLKGQKIPLKEITNEFNENRVGRVSERTIQRDLHIAHKEGHIPHVVKKCVVCCKERREWQGFSPFIT